MTASEEARDRARDALTDVLESSGFAGRNLTVLDRGDDEVDIVATLATTSAATEELRPIVFKLSACA